MKPTKDARIYVAEDNDLYRDMLKSLFQRHSGWRVAGESDQGRQAVSDCTGDGFDLAVIDLFLPDLSGFGAIGLIKDKRPELPILAITAYEDDAHLYRAFEVGADGFVPKETDSDDLFMAVRSLLHGYMYVSPRRTRTIVGGYLLALKNGRGESLLDSLTQREIEVLRLVAAGSKNVEIAESLFISPKTVEKHRSNIIRKFGLDNPRELVPLARKLLLSL